MCRPVDPLELLLEWQKPGRLEEFRAALAAGETDGARADPNRVYGQPYCASLLDEAVQRDREGGFVAECMGVLLACPRLLVNQTNRKGQTPIFIAASKNQRETVRILLQHGVMVDVDKTYNKSTARQLIKEKFNDVFDEELNAIIPAEKDMQLKDFLDHRDVDGFLELLEQKKDKEPNKEWVDANDGSYTLLQKAVKDRLFDPRLIKIVKALLESGADPSLTTPGQQTLPAQFAARNGDSDVLELLCKHGAKITSQDGKTALHDVIEKADPESITFEKYKKCFTILLDNKNENYLSDINSQDSIGNTPLHLAVKYGIEDFTLKLLEKGAYIGTKNKFGDIPIVDLSPVTLRNFLDKCVTSEKSSRDDDYKVLFDVNFLKPPDESVPFCDSNSINSYKIPISDDRVPTNPVECECAPLLHISKVKDLRPVLNHPVITSFLEIKWRGIRSFFWINLCFYLLFVSLLTIYILFYYESALGDLKDLVEEDGPAALIKPSSDSPPKNATKNDTGHEMPSSLGCKIIWIIVSVLFIVLVLREFFQLIVAPKHYIYSLENYLEILLLVFCGFVLFHPSVGPRTRPHLSAITILLSWAELVLLIGRHPRLSTNIEMLKTVSMNFLKFLAWYSLLIFAFALSFYSLFRSSTEEDNFFLDPGSSFFKTVVMVTGEFEAGELPFVMFPGTSHIVFVLFVFLVAIVLFNLLNGLAVSDTQAIREDAELVGIVSRINLVSYTEKILLSHPFWCRKCKDNDCCFFQAFSFLQKLPLCSLTNQAKKVRLFPYVLPDGKISVLPNQASEIYFSPESRKATSDDECCKPLDCRYYLDVSILKAADKILQSQKNPSCNEGCTHFEKISQLEAKLEDLNETSQKNQEMLQKIMQLLENAYNAQLIKEESFEAI
ncbi:Transient receptor potential cation channel protein painless [Gryllus bimaculatus]|nr:Transient receptor potential cation channel protein painless [Gryllus bimaculatus]